MVDPVDKIIDILEGRVKKDPDYKKNRLNELGALSADAMERALRDTVESAKRIHAELREDIWHHTKEVAELEGLDHDIVFNETMRLYKRFTQLLGE